MMYLTRAQSKGRKTLELSDSFNRQNKSFKNLLYGPNKQQIILSSLKSGKTLRRIVTHALNRYKVPVVNNDKIVNHLMSFYSYFTNQMNEPLPLLEITPPVGNIYSIKTDDNSDSEDSHIGQEEGCTGS